MLPNLLLIFSSIKYIFFYFRNVFFHFNCLQISHLFRFDVEIITLRFAVRPTAPKALEQTTLSLQSFGVSYWRCVIGNGCVCTCFFLLSQPRRGQALHKTFEGLSNQNGLSNTWMYSMWHLILTEKSSNFMQHNWHKPSCVVILLIIRKFSMPVFFIHYSAFWSKRTILTDKILTTKLAQTRIFIILIFCIFVFIDSWIFYLFLIGFWPENILCRIEGLLNIS